MCNLVLDFNKQGLSFCSAVQFHDVVQPIEIVNPGDDTKAPDSLAAGCTRLHGAKEVEPLVAEVKQCTANVEQNLFRGLLLL